ncbi:hypothetical protein AAL_03912 [Moelleriella libera RCEF 2490]|uniref:Uncharacterized protein n=1 Tax=Moelleriella libera RCEF 2490 TaxID=1081109 RepID=A0A162IQ49_9HYPO|nr:hypothetical protein AAL_03912 [Moelleriella libera RCEF 2490]
MAAVPSNTPPLLLTKRLNAFLHANQTAQLPTLLLTTYHGKLLAHASPQHPVSVLRTHATVAASLLAIHTSSSVDVPSALPGSRTPDPISSSPPSSEDHDHNSNHHDNHHEDHNNPTDSSYDRGPAASAAATASSRTRVAVQPVTITVQLSGGTFIIRRLKCGLLFVCVGPSAQDLHSDALHENGDAAGSSPSDGGSFVTVDGQTSSSLDSMGAASVVAMRRQAGELARWLDDKLGTLSVPEEGVGSID